MKIYSVRGYPTLFIANPEGKVIEQIRDRSPAGFVKHMQSAISKMGPLKSAKDSKRAQEYQAQLMAAYMKQDFPKMMQLWTELQEEAKTNRELQPIVAMIKEKIKGVEGNADSDLAKAKKLLEEKKYDEAQAILKEVSKKYKGLDQVSQAEEMLDEMKTDPELKNDIAEQKAQKQAKRLYKLGLKAEKEEIDGNPNYLKAGNLYFQIIKEYPKTPEAERSKKKLDKFKTDREIKKIVREQRAAEKSKKWLELARNFADNGKNDKAIEYLNRIISKYKGTSWARKAQDMKDELDD